MSKKSKTETTAPPALADHPFRAIRRAAVPLVAFESADPRSTMIACQKVLNGKPVPCLEWNVLAGLHGANALGEVLASSIGEPLETQNLPQCLGMIADKYNPGDNLGAVFFIHGGARVLDDWTVAQGLWNLRDRFKAVGATIVLLGPAFRVPAELRHDVVVITEELPREAQLEAIARATCAEAGLPTDPDWSKVVDTLRGLSAFGAEQVVAMSVTKSNDDKPALDMSGLWERKRKLVEQTPGLSVWRGGERFDDIGGCDNVKRFLRDILKGNAAPRAICFIDEAEKSLAANSSDTSGVSQDYMRALLTYMQDSEAAGMIFVGPPGAAKSAIAKAAGNEGGIPTIAMDLGGMKGSLVGESEQRLRAALQVVDAVSAKQTLFIATCNSLAILPPELKRRFTLGTFFFPLPTKAEREMIWAIYETRYSLTTTKRPADEEWTGAEIKQCCVIAWRLRCSLEEASKFIVPVAVSARDAIERLCREAHRKFINASNPGLYEYNKAVAQQPARKFEAV